MQHTLKLAVHSAAIALAGLLAFSVPASGRAAPPDPAGGLDQRFGDAGIASTPLSPATADRFLAATVGKDGKTYATGFVTVEGTDQAMAVARITPAGALDSTFDGDGFAVANVAPNRSTAELARGIGVQSNGKVVIAGQAESTAPAADPQDLDIYVSRFNANGTLDTTFAGDGTLELNLSPGAQNPAPGGGYRTDQSYGVVVLPSDKIVIVGARGPDLSARPGRVDRDFAIIQLTKNGALDPSWGRGGITFINTRGVINGVEEDLNESPRQATLHGSKIIVGSYSEGSNGAAFIRIMRFLPNGTLDKTFSSDGIATAPLLGEGDQVVAEAYDVGVQGTKYVMTGYGSESLTGKVDMISARFSSKGKWDKTYGDNGLIRVNIAGDDDRGRDLVVLPDKRVLIVGSGKPTPANLNAMAVMITAKGQLDRKFDGDGILLKDLGGPGDSFFGVALTKDNKKAFVAGWRGGSATGQSPLDDARVARILAGTP